LARRFSKRKHVKSAVTINVSKSIERTFPRANKNVWHWFF